VIEGKYNEVMAVVEKVKNICFNAGANDLLINLKLQVRKDQHVTIIEKTGKYD
jgi:uncharacterized protein YqgV (UPF0045/DUF77 family)